MNETKRRTAVGAGTTAGDAVDEEQAPESRAAEAETEGLLESLRVTESAPTGVAGDDAHTPAPGSRGDVVDTGPGAVHPERPHPELAHNQAGIASRIEPRK
jgi:hypothetical protein